MDRPDTAVTHAPSATELIAAAVRQRVPQWVENRLYDFIFVFGDPDAEQPGRHIICDGMTDHPIITANVNRIRMTLDLPHVSDASDRQTVLDVLAAVGAFEAG